MELLHVSCIAKSKLKIAIFVILLIAISVLCLMSSLYLLIQVLIFTAAVIFQLFRHNLKERLTFFYSRLAWKDPNSTHLAIYTRASRLDSRHLSSRIFIV